MEASTQTRFRDILKAGALCTTYICLSGALIMSNKFLMRKDRFPHALTLTTMHMLASVVLSSVAYVAMPSMFPAMESIKGKEWAVMKWMVPIGSCFALMLYGSNQAYAYCSVAFLQFMKEANVVIVFAFSCMAGLQVMNRQRLFVIAWVIFGSSMCVVGDVHFVLIGFLLQAMSQLAECTRAVMAEWVLNGNSMKLDPMTYTLFIAPVSLSLLLFADVATWNSAIVADIKTWWPYLIPNACLAFALNLTIASVIKNLSAFGFIITGVVKDIVLVVSSSAFLGDAITSRQCLSFIVTLSGVFFWSLMKVSPDAVAVRALERMLLVPDSKAGETTRLVGADHACPNAVAEKA